MRNIVIGSRKSQLALVQTHWVLGELQKLHPDRSFSVVTMTTHGDNVLDVALAKIGDKGLFTKELELAMLDKRIDLAVHSLKDLPTKLPTGLSLAAITERENPADALVLSAKYKGYTLESLPAGAVVGTSSLRRLAQLRHHFPQFQFKDVRGNLNTRLGKLDAGEFDALVLAVAGLHRLGLRDRISQVLPPEISLHAVGQGALGIECRSDDTEVQDLLQRLIHQPTQVCCLAERAFLQELEGGCQVPIGVNSQCDGATLTLTGIVASLDGQELVRGQVTGNSDQPEAIGRELAQKLKAEGGQAILEGIFAQFRPSKIEMM
ncbi:MAG: hydroxymethylbilane synthase [Pseudanabaenaceae cyanobacterium]